MAPPTDHPLNPARRGIFILARGFVLAVVVAGTQVHLASARWWWSPTVVSALGITPEQSVAIERLSEDNLPARVHAGEEVIDLTARVGTLIRSDVYDDELLRLTEQLLKAYSVQWELHRQMLAPTTRALSPQQREKLTRLIA